MVAQSSIGQIVSSEYPRNAKAEAEAGPEYGNQWEMLDEKVTIVRPEKLMTGLTSVTGEQGKVYSNDLPKDPDKPNGSVPLVSGMVEDIPDGSPFEIILKTAGRVASIMDRDMSEDTRTKYFGEEQNWRQSLSRCFHSQRPYPDDGRFELETHAYGTPITRMFLTGLLVQQLIDEKRLKLGVLMMSEYRYNTKDGGPGVRGIMLRYIPLEPAGGNPIVVARFTPDVSRNERLFDDPKYMCSVTEVDRDTGNPVQIEDVFIARPERRRRPLSMIDASDSKVSGPDSDDRSRRGARLRVRAFSELTKEDQLEAVREVASCILPSLASGIPAYLRKSAETSGFKYCHAEIFRLFEGWEIGETYDPLINSLDLDHSSFWSRFERFASEVSSGNRNERLGPIAEYLAQVYLLYPELLPSVEPVDLLFGISTGGEAKTQNFDTWESSQIKDLELPPFGNLAYHYLSRRHYYVPYIRGDEQPLTDRMNLLFQTVVRHLTPPGVVSKANTSLEVSAHYAPTVSGPASPLGIPIGDATTPATGNQFVANGSNGVINNQQGEPKADMPAGISSANQIPVPNLSREALEAALTEVSELVLASLRKEIPDGIGRVYPEDHFLSLVHDWHLYRDLVERTTGVGYDRGSTPEKVQALRRRILREIRSGERDTELRPVARYITTVYLTYPSLLAASTPVDLMSKTIPILINSSSYTSVAAARSGIDPTGTAEGQTFFVLPPYRISINDPSVDLCRMYSSRIPVNLMRSPRTVDHLKIVEACHRHLGENLSVAPAIMDVANVAAQAADRPVDTGNFVSVAPERTHPNMQHMDLVLRLVDDPNAGFDRAVEYCREMLQAYLRQKQGEVESERKNVWRGFVELFRFRPDQKHILRLVDVSAGSLTAETLEAYIEEHRVASTLSILSATVFRGDTPDQYGRWSLHPDIVQLYRRNSLQEAMNLWREYPTDTAGRFSDVSPEQLINFIQSRADLVAEFLPRLESLSSFSPEEWSGQVRSLLDEIAEAATKNGSILGQILRK